MKTVVVLFWALVAIPLMIVFGLSSRLATALGKILIVPVDFVGDINNALKRWDG